MGMPPKFKRVRRGRVSQRVSPVHSWAMATFCIDSSFGAVARIPAAGVKTSMVLNLH